MSYSFKCGAVNRTARDGNSVRTKRLIRQLVRRLCLTMFTCVLITGCASTAESGDPFEGLNRGIYGFNKALDSALVRSGPRILDTPLSEILMHVQAAKTGAA